MAAGLRPRLVLDSARRSRLHPRHPAQGMGKAQGAPRREVKERFLKSLSREIERRGALDVLRNGIKDAGCKFHLAYFRPASGLNEETSAPPCSQFVLRRASASVQRDEREQPGPGALPEWHSRSSLRRSRIRSSGQNGEGGDRAVQDRPGPPRAAASPTAAAWRTSRWIRIWSM